jgi:hypothetical protein
MTESQLEKKVCAWAKDSGISTLKLSGPNDRGKADRVFMRAGRIMFLEFKAAGKKPTALQERFLEQRVNDGFVAVWTDNYLKAIDILDKFFSYE